MGALALTVGASFAIRGNQEPKLKSGKPGKGGLSLLPPAAAPARNRGQEPSGIAFNRSPVTSSWSAMKAGWWS